MNNVQQGNDGGAIVGDGNVTLGVDQLIHAAGSEGGLHDIDNRLAGVDVADDLGTPLGLVGSFTQKQDAGLLILNSLQACVTFLDMILKFINLNYLNAQFWFS